MLTGRKTYRRDTLRRNQSVVARAGSLAALTVFLGGCAGLGLPVGDFDRAAQRADLSRVAPIKASFAVTDSVDASDWRMISQTIAEVPAGETGEYPWSNPDNRSSGTVTVLTSGGDTCRVFAATVNDAVGIRGYRGKACHMPDGAWQLQGVSPDDAKLL